VITAPATVAADARHKRSFSEHRAQIAVQAHGVREQPLGLGIARDPLRPRAGAVRLPDAGARGALSFATRAHRGRLVVRQA
jgi:hypothetical protein